MNDLTSPITRQELEDAIAAAPKLDTADLVRLHAHLDAARTPVVFNCGIPTAKIFGIKSRLDALEVHLAAADLKGEERMVAIFDAEEKNKTRGAAPKTVIGPSKHGKFRNDDGSVNLASVLDFEAEAKT